MNVLKIAWWRLRRVKVFIRSIIRLFRIGLTIYWNVYSGAFVPPNVVDGWFKSIDDFLGAIDGDTVVDHRGCSTGVWGSMNRNAVLFKSHCTQFGGCWIGLISYHSIKVRERACSSVG